MIKSKIEFADHTLNLLTGCQYDCPNCSAKITALNYGGDQRRNLTETEKYHRDGEILVIEEPLRASNGHVKPYPFGFRPTYHRYNIGKILSKMHMGQTVYVGAMSEMFDPWVPDYVIEEIFAECLKYPRNNYLFLTHNPRRYAELAAIGKLPQEENFWYGSSVPSAECDWFCAAGYHTFVNIEPIKQDFGKWAASADNFPEWIIIGAETGKHKGKVVPEFEWIRKIVVEADYHAVPVFMRDSLLPVVGEKNMRRDVPIAMQVKTMSEKMEKRLIGKCQKCGETRRRNDMVTINARVRKGKNKTIMAMCRECYMGWCRELGIDSRVEELYEEKEL